MRTKATVISVNGKNATVEAVRASACDGCHKTREGGSCSVCSLMGAKKKFTASAANPIGASVGDIVEIETETGRVLQYAGLVFLLPIILAVLGYGIASVFTDRIAVLACSAVLGFVATFAFLFVYSRWIHDHRTDVKIVAITEKNAASFGNAEAAAEIPDSGVIRQNANSADD